MKKCKQENDIFGKLLSYEVEGNTINVKFKQEKVYVKIINSYIINFFAPLYREERNSKAVENLRDNHCDFEIENIENGIQINTKKLLV